MIEREGERERGRERGREGESEREREKRKRRGGEMPRLRDKGHVHTFIYARSYVTTL